MEAKASEIEATTAESEEAAESRELTEEEAGAGCGVCMIEPSWDGIIGFKRYNYKYLCTPSVPCLTEGGVEPPMFLGKDEKLPLMLSLIMGLQHALAMVAGIATSGGLLIAGDACFAWQYDSEMCDAREYLISAAWITSGLLTIVQVFRARILGTRYYLGTGLVSVMGTSFTFLPIARDMVVSEINDARNEGKCSSDGDCNGFGKQGYGKFLGTAMVASIFEMCIAMLPTKVRQKLFPTVVTGAAVMLIGGSLISSGIKYVGGGVFCAENDLSRSASFGSPQFCNENGNVALPFGSPEYIGLAFSVIAMSTFLQFFGSPSFLCGGVSARKKSVIVSQNRFSLQVPQVDVSLLGPDVRRVCVGHLDVRSQGRRHDRQGRQSRPGQDRPSIQVLQRPADPRRQLRELLVTRQTRDDSFCLLQFIFLWDTTFPIRFAPEYFLPILIGFFVSSAETIGDITMSCVASRLPASGADLESRIQGGLLADGFNSLLATLFTSPPNTTFSQNNGVIALSQCASRAAGFACSFWLLLFGVIAKVGAAFASIPICVVGGLVLQCFSMVFVSGMSIATRNYNRRNAFILMLSLGLGIGVAMEPNLFEAGGGVSFFANNLDHNYGFWPRHKTCKKFPRVDAVDVVSDATCTVGNYTWTSNDDDFTSVCAGLDGTYVDAVTVTTNERVKTCVNDNGACCDKYYKRKKSSRTTVILLLNTPYCIGFCTALILHLLLPEDKTAGEDYDEPDFEPVGAAKAKEIEIEAEP